MTRDEILKEIVRSGKDPLYFLNTYARISHPIKGLIPFDTYTFQDSLVKDFKKHRFNVILKARQLGITTITAGYVVWMMMFHRNKNILVMATKFDTAANLVRKVKAIMKDIPPWLQIAKISVDNRASFELSNGSQIKAAATSGDAGRSEALSLLVLDEAAHIDGLDELWTGLYPALSTGGTCIALSTPSGVGNWFHQTYIDADQGANDFHPTILPWHIHPDRDQAWFDNETKNMSTREIAQELQCNFNMSGETVMDPKDIERITANVSEPLYRTGLDRNFYIWKEFNPTSSYLLVSDVARGDGADFSAFHVVDVTNMEQVAEYQGKMEIDLFSDFLLSAAKQYGEPMVVVENNNIGYSVLQKLIDRSCPNLYYSTKGSNDYVDPLTAESMSNSLAGFTTSVKSRPLIIAKLEEFIRNNAVKINSARFANELATFIWNNGKPEAMRGYNDDLIMSMAIACWVRDTALVSNQRDMDYNKAFLDSMIATKTILNTSIPGMYEHRPGEESYNTRRDEAQVEAEKWAWLYKG